MSASSMIDKYGEDVEILRDNEIISTIKVLFQKGNKVHFKPDEDIRNGDQIHRIKTTDILTVMRVNPVANEYIEVIIE